MTIKNKQNDMIKLLLKCDKVDPNALIYPKKITILDFVKDTRDKKLIDLFDKYSASKSWIN